MSKKLLSEVIILRMVLILLLVLYHAFAPFMGKWAELSGMWSIPSYYWIAKTSYAFMLESFVFISGYVMAYQVQARGSAILELRTIATNKAKRLLLPSIVFSIAYYLMFYDMNALIPTILYKIINGCGHMWFLPMLFWCFIFLAVIEDSNLTLKWKLLLVVSLTFIHPLPIPLRINSALLYFLFFYAGYQLKLHEQLLRRKTLYKIIMAGLPLFLIVFIATDYLFDSETALLINGGGKRLVDSNAFANKIVISVLRHICHIVYAMTGTLVFFAISKIYSLSRPLPQYLVLFSSYCFGVYLYQQFILIFLYYHTSFHELVGIMALPWLGFIIALVASVILTMLTRAVPIGKKLIG